MKNMKKLIAMMLMMASVLFFSCENDDEKTLPKEEAKTEITQLATDVGAKMEEMQSTEGLEVMDMFSSLPDPFTSKKSNARSPIFSTITKYLMPINPQRDKSALVEPGFDFEGNVGTYEYVHATIPGWNIVPGGDKIVIKFPSDELHMDVNDAVLTINSYTEVLIGLDYMPTKIDADLTVKDIKVVDIDLTATWETTGELAGEPKTLDLIVYLLPFDFVVNFSNVGTKASIDVAIEYQDAQFFSAGVDATFETSTLDDDPINISGYIQFFDVKFQASVDLKDLEIVFENIATYTTPEALIAAVNKEISAAVYVSGAKAADIQLAYKEVPAGSDDLPIDIVFVYSDGTSESALPYFEDLALELEDFFGELEEYYGSW